jgi:CO/xanthine dehydrogenase Mo-binding subunit
MDRTSVDRARHETGAGTALRSRPDDRCTAPDLDDLVVPGMLHGRAIRSPVARGRLDAIRLAFDPRGFTIVDYRDVPGRNVVPLVDDDQPCLAEHDVYHAGEPILLLAHDDPLRLRGAGVQIEITPRPALFDPELSARAFRSIVVEKGHLDEGLQRADAVIEGEYRMGPQHDPFLAPLEVVAVPEREGITVYGSVPSAATVERAVSTVLGIDMTRVHVVQTAVRGRDPVPDASLGQQDDLPHLACHAALLAWKARRPVKMVCSREEELILRQPYHPAIIRHRTGVSREGRLTAMEIDILLDGGAYTAFSPLALSSAVVHATGPYICPHVRIRGRAVRTNSPPGRLCRAAGSSQVQFAIEVHMDRIASAMRLDPVALRLINAMSPGEITATGQTLPPETSARDVLREAVRRSGFRRKRRQWLGTTRAIGLSLFFQAPRARGGAAAADPLAVVDVRTSDPARMHSFRVAAGGEPTTWVSRRGSLDTDRDSSDTPADVPGQSPHARLGAPESRTASARDHSTPIDDGLGAYLWGCDVVEIDLDPITSEIRPRRITAIVGIGRARASALPASQIKRDAVQALGRALREGFVMGHGQSPGAWLVHDGSPPSWREGLEVVAAALTVPGRRRARSTPIAGELSLVGPAPAVVNALRHAGFDIRSIPVTAERVRAAARVAIAEGAGTHSSVAAPGPTSARSTANARKTKTRKTKGEKR